MTTSERVTARGPAHLAPADWKWPAPWISSPSAREDGSTPAADPETEHGPSALTRLHVERDVSPWLDRLSRHDLLDGTLARMVSAGVRGVGAGQTELTHALEATAADDEQLLWLLRTGCSAGQAYWELAATDSQAACATLRSVYELSHGADGFVSLQTAPVTPRRTRASTAMICQLHQRIDRPNLLIAVPATAAAVPTLRASVSAGCNVATTSLFSLARYAEVIDAYQSGIETLLGRGGDPSTVHSVASFSLALLDAEVDGRLDQLGADVAPELRGLAATAQATLARRVFDEQFSTARWARLAKRGATPQRLAWATSETDSGINPLRYLDAMSAPNTIQLLDAQTVASLHDTAGLGVTAPRVDVRDAARVWSDLAASGASLDDLGIVLEKRAAARADASLDDALDHLSARARLR